MKKSDKPKIINNFKIKFTAKSCNEAFARSVTGAFVSQLDPTVEELCDIKTAVSEAVTNCIVHAYGEGTGTVTIEGNYDSDNLVTVRIKDRGCGIDDVKKALLPMYTTGGEDRSGMGFSIMQCFTDKLSVKSVIGKGTTVTLKKYIGICKNGQ